MALNVQSEQLQQMVVGTKLANVLNANCKELQHLDIWPISWRFFQYFIPSAEFTCLLPLHYEHFRFIKSRKVPFEQLFALKMLKVKTADLRPWELINKLPVEHLSALHWKDKFNELVNLKSLVSRGELKQIGNFHHIEEIQLLRASATGLRRIFETNPNWCRLCLTVMLINC